MQVILEALTGSRLHKLHSPSSDFDWKKVKISPLVEVLSPFRTQNANHINEETGETVVYELQHFAKLAAKCNPTVLEMLWSNPMTDHTGDWLVKNRALFLHKEYIYFAHRGYAKSQWSLIKSPGASIRQAKAVIANIRILTQGISLLQTGTFTPVVPEDKREPLLKIKLNPSILDTELNTYLDWIHRLEKDLEDAYSNCNIQFNQDISQIEKFLETAYIARR